MQDFDREAAAAETAEELWQLCHSALELLGMTSVFYGIVPFAKTENHRNRHPDIFYKTSHPTEWLESFGPAGPDASDITIMLTMLGEEVVFWQDEELWEEASDAQNSRAHMERQDDMQVGVSFGLHRRQGGGFLSGVGLAFSKTSEADFPSVWTDIESRARGICHGLDTGLRERFSDQMIGLRSKEAEYLRLLADGLRPADIADRLVISEKTLEKYAMSARMKLRSATRDQAVAKAVKMGVV